MSDIDYLITKLKNGEHDGTDIMAAWIALKNYQALKASNKELLEALELNDAMLTKGIFNCTDDEIRNAVNARKTAITNAKQGEK